MLQVEHLSVRYGENIALDDISFTIPRQRVVGIIGPNGAGKSTLIKAMLGLVPLSGGQVLLKGKPLLPQRQRVAYIPQRASIDWDFPATVQDVVLMGLTPYLKLSENLQEKHYTLVNEALNRVRMAEFSQGRIGELSGGQQQRVFLARSLVQAVDLYLLDEPLVGVDQTTEQVILNIFDELRAEGKSVLVVNHDLGQVVKRYDDILLLRKNLVAFGERDQVFNSENLNRAYAGQVALV
ncbi:metal ABC transporter ATP-binding protein [Candidatus Cyanaurora vandensis]|uniref:metal ABC transporter ATP-binding protein n=1 Tax=Candidatus Cyanaurora vandensis TaxID=2714958 RepID=UPI00257F04F1|nr:metal ABC transporter ATP-binding protein [Candidatus Cyanaurora vandensis]